MTVRKILASESEYSAQTGSDGGSVSSVSAVAVKRKSRADSRAVMAPFREGFLAARHSKGEKGTDSQEKRRSSINMYKRAERNEKKRLGNGSVGRKE